MNECTNEERKKGYCITIVHVVKTLNKTCGKTSDKKETIFLFYIELK